MIQLKNAKKFYTVEVGLNKVNLEFKNGEIVGILGENGSGKTTMLKAIMGLMELTEGSITIDGKLPSEMYNEMAYITEEGSYFPDLTPYEYGEFLSVFFKKFDTDRYYKLLKFFELDSSKKIRTFSNGQKAKLEISAGFAKRARFILMDEPFLGKDLLTRRDFLKLMISSLKEDETILISTHQLDDIENFIDRAIFLRHGLVKADYYMDDLKDQGKTLAQIMMEVTGYDENRYKMLFEG